MEIRRRSSNHSCFLFIFTSSKSQRSSVKKSLRSAFMCLSSELIQLVFSWLNHIPKAAGFQETLAFLYVHRVHDECCSSFREVEACLIYPPHASSFCTVSGRRGCDGYLWGDVWSDWRPARGSDNHSAGPGHLWTSTCFHRLRLNQRRRRPAKSKRLKFYYSQCSAAPQIIHSRLYLCYYCLFAPKE